MIASDWTYAGEGGKHVIFAHRSSTANALNPEWRGCLLRIKKDYLKMAGCFKDLPNSVAIPEDTCLYFRSCILPKLAPYVDAPQSIRLHWSFVAVIREASLTSGKIPEGRLKDWSLVSAESTEKPMYPTASLVPDYRLQLPSSVNFSKSRSITVEIKPKAGYRAYSPLVHPTTRFKYRYTRYTFIQWIKTGNVSVPSNDHPAYDPVDLFSQDAQTVERALLSLLREPRNNFIVWHGRESMMTLKNGEPTIDDRKLSDALPFNGLQGGEEQNFLIRILTSVLHTEPFLQDLLQLQNLDILDADGAVLVYRRLVWLCNGSEDEAEILIDRLDSLVSQTLGEAPPSLNEHSPIPFPSKSNKIDLICYAIQTFREILLSQEPIIPNKQIMDSFRKRTVGIVETLDKEECVYLLQNWMLSLAMCDISFFVSFCFEASKDIDVLHSGRCAVTVKSTQQDGLPGLVEIAGEDVFYQIRVIDTDKKPARKLRYRQRKEESLALFALWECRKDEPEQGRVGS
jgi:inositol-pentakisphosphate 2-kinase